MASPQRPDPNESRRDYRDYEDLKRARMERQTSAGAGFAWWWAFWIIVIGLAVWWAGWDRLPFLNRQLRHARLAYRANVDFLNGLVEPCRQQSLDYFLADFSTEAPADYRLRHLSYAEAGYLRLFPEASGHAAVGLRYLFRGNVQNQLPGAFGVEYRSMLVVVGVVLMPFVGLRILRRVGLRIAFEGIR